MLNAGKVWWIELNTEIKVLDGQWLKAAGTFASEIVLTCKALLPADDLPNTFIIPILLQNPVFQMGYVRETFKLLSYSILLCWITRETLNYSLQAVQASLVSFLFLSVLSVCFEFVFSYIR